MKVIIACFLLSMALALTGNVQAGEVVAKPTADAVISYSEAVTKSSSSDRKLAAEALQKWMDGTLTKEEASKYKDALKLPQKDGERATRASGEQCLACIAGCCFWWGCNPACQAACALGACK